MAKLVDSLNEYQLPTVPCMVKPTFTESHEFHRVMIDELKERQDIESQWALQMIARLQQLWFEAGDKLSEIERIVSR
jgi:hypothetical protein